jgi:hypothetical protein
MLIAVAGFSLRAYDTDITYAADRQNLPEEFAVDEAVHWIFVFCPGFPDRIIIC